VRSGDEGRDMGAATSTGDQEESGHRLAVSRPEGRRGQHGMVEEVWACSAAAVPTSVVLWCRRVTRGQGGESWTHAVTIVVSRSNTSWLGAERAGDGGRRVRQPRA
jgi:hypothetical protein